MPRESVCAGVRCARERVERERESERECDMRESEREVLAEETGREREMSERVCAVSARPRCECLCWSVEVRVRCAFSTGAYP